MSSPVTLQISLAPSDYRHAVHLLAHQVRCWRSQVKEILITVDFHRSSGRFSERWEEGTEKILPLARSIQGARVIAVDYSADAMARTGMEFFGRHTVPTKDFRGGPYYAYFFGLHAAEHPCVLHTDSDMFFGGNSQNWLVEAITHYEAHPEVLFAAPLPGPPTASGALRSQTGTAVPDLPHAFQFNTMSTRLFLLDRRRFASTVRALRRRRPGAFRNTLKAWLEGNPAQDLPEHLFTAGMRAGGLSRIEFLGTAPGMWSLHPPYRCADFYARLPALIARIEQGDMPEEQRGDHDINSSLVDWSEGIASLRHNRWWRRLISRIR